MFDVILGKVGALVTPPGRVPWFPAVEEATESIHPGDPFGSEIAAVPV